MKAKSIISKCRIVNKNGIGENLVSSFIKI